MPLKVCRGHRLPVLRDIRGGGTDEPLVRREPMHHSGRVPELPDVDDQVPGLLRRNRGPIRQGQSYIDSRVELAESGYYGHDIVPPKTQRRCQPQVATDDTAP